MKYLGKVAKKEGLRKEEKEEGFEEMRKWRNIPTNNRMK